LLAIVLAALFLRIGWVAYAGVQPRFASDPQAYLLQGETLARGEGYVNPLVGIANAIHRERHEPLEPASPASFYPPGYPVFVAAVVWVVWHTPIPDTATVRTVGYVQALLGAISVLLAFAIARAAFSTRVGLVAAAFVAFYPNLVATTATLQLETFFVFLTLTTVFVLLPVAVDDRPGLGRLVAGGALTGIVALVRPTIGLVIVALLATLLVGRVPPRMVLRSVGVVLLVMGAAIAPWTIRNQVRLHAFVPISTGIGPTVCVSRNDEATGVLDTDLMYRRCQPHRRFSSPAALDVATNSFGTRRAIEWVTSHPEKELGMWVRRTRIAFRDDTSGLADMRDTMSHGWANVATFVSNAASFVVLALATVGAVVVARRRNRGSLFVLAVALALSTQPIILYGDPRYRVPAEPFFAMLAAAGAVAAVAAVRRQIAAEPVTT
jgi:4-amino-4-deoxy-L-arabinose transferase-like glycosyltransferase